MKRPDHVSRSSGRSSEFSTQVSYYHGVEGGESWSEGKRRKGALFKIRDPGTYRLRVSGEAGSHEAADATRIPFTLTLYAGYHPRRYLLAGLIISLLCAWILFDKRWGFERKRWAEVIEDDDDDD